MGTVDESYGYWIVGTGLRFGPFADYESAERCLISVASRADTSEAEIFRGHKEQTDSIVSPPSTSSQESRRGASPSRR